MRDVNIKVLNQRLDISNDFKKYDNAYFNMNELIEFDGKNGKIKWDRYNRKYRMSFNAITAPFEKTNSWEFPAEYEVDEIGKFKISFISENCVRIRMDNNHRDIVDEDSLMILNKVQDIESEIIKDDNKYIIKGKKYSINIYKRPFNIEIINSNGESILKTFQIEDNKGLDNTYPIPFSYIREISSFKRKIAASFELKYDEKLYGLGESFTRLNKRGQKINLWTYDALGAQNRDMYKPIPFYFSNKGYGIFMHTSSAITCDLGRDYDGVQTIYLDDDKIDFFIFLGEPKEILEEYTSLTGRAKMPPIWSFGLWMSRITYDNEKQVREVSKRLREEKIPCDVIHLDTGWFEEDWKCNYKFSESRFIDPKKMMEDLKEEGFRVSLWQLPYITPTNSLYKEALENKYYIKGYDGEIPTEDIIIDFSNEKAVKWYQEKLKELFEMGVSAIKVDFGEAAPYEALYSSGKSGRFEHNLYPLRYNKAVNEITYKINNENIMWARSAWAGSQRYPVHWGGDAEITDSSMAASLRAGLSLGLCGFTFWSHDIGGFTFKSPENLYKRWIPFGMLTSHSRTHGQPPKEPWEYTNEFKEIFRKSVELKYQLLPYILKESKYASEKGYPLLRTLFFEYPTDEFAWNIEDEYLFGRDILVAPLFEENKDLRKVYIPEGIWIDYFTKEKYNGNKYYEIKSTDLPIIILIKEGSKIPMIPVYQSTDFIDWSKEYIVEF
ncbi:glycoside hydrolase family 31 protein [Streptobacillus canis]|uniref:glycoside hydrolase family 31 protein n=1 Tax=Streptobacillus canis TaxID=2678686 RepID=UPI0012E175AD|nr:TIM-barrel domain-containing protein [Streptobacillus canis]